LGRRITAAFLECGDHVAGLSRGQHSDVRRQAPEGDAAHYDLRDREVAALQLADQFRATYAGTQARSDEAVPFDRLRVADRRDRGGGVQPSHLHTVGPANCCTGRNAAADGRW
jgi:hypothetical protein